MTSAERPDRESSDMPREVDLPPLPPPSIGSDKTVLMAFFRGDVVQDYARAAVLADREARKLPPRRVKAWIRGVITPSTPHDPAQYDEECVPGEDQPEGDGWMPLVLAL
jgi:hypothetical protein